MLFHGLYHSCLTASNIRALDSWYVKALRRVAGIKPAFIKHISNSFVYDRTSTEPVSHLWFSRAVKYFGHLLRHPEQSISTVCLQSNVIERSLTTAAPSRVGAPKQHLFPQMLKTVRNKLHTPELHTQLPQPLQKQYYQIINIRNIAQQKPLWKKLLAPTHIQDFISPEITADHIGSAG